MSHAMPSEDADLVLQALELEVIQLTEGEITAAAQGAVIEQDPERAWTRYLRGLAITALKADCQRRRANVIIGPELDPEEPDRLLAVNGRTTQLVCVSSMVDGVEIPTKPWLVSETAAQLVLLAQVDEDQGLVHFPGVLDGAAFVSDLRQQKAQGDAVLELQVERFQGGLDRLLQWVTLLEPEALPRAGVSSDVGKPDVELLDGLKEWLVQLLSGPSLIRLPVLGTRGGAIPELRLITPQAQRADDGSAFAEAVCATPTIWADALLAEVVIEKEGKVLWQQLATRRNPIEGPIAWPLAALDQGQQFTIRLRPWGAPGGAYAALCLMAPESDTLQSGEEVIGRQLKKNWLTDQRTKPEADRTDQAVASEVRARVWLRLVRDQTSN